jgi:hypothetical protein
MKPVGWFAFGKLLNTRTFENSLDYKLQV